MDDYALVLNAGSSSLKFCVYRRPEVEAWRLEARGQIEGIGTSPRFSAKDAFDRVLADDPLNGGVTDGRTALGALAVWLRSRYGGARVLGIGHRVVHGGAKFAGPTVVTPAVLEDLRQLIPLAPLHQPHNLAAIEAVFERLPGVPQVACFDTSFHRGQPAVAELIPLPREMCRAGVQRYGFHGLSYEYHRLRPATGRTRDRPGARHRGSPGQRRQPVRAEKRPERGQQPRVHRARRPLHGDQAGCPRSRRGPLPLSEPRALGRRRRNHSLQEIGSARRLRHQQRHARPAREHRARRPARRGLLRVPRRQGNRRARRRSRRDRRPGVHRRHRGELSRDPRAHLGRLLVARDRSGPGRELAKGTADLSSREPGVGLGDPDQRGIDDRPAHGLEPGADRSPLPAGQTAKDCDGVSDGEPASRALDGAGASLAARVSG